MKSLKIKNFGPIGNVDVKFGDLTFLVGPQASGKSLFLELLKYVIDKDYVLANLRKFNYIIDKNNPKKFLIHSLAMECIRYSSQVQKSYIMVMRLLLTPYLKEMYPKRKPCSIFLLSEY